MKTIYKITNIINNKSYIGQTSKNIFDRWKTHIYDSKRDKCKHRLLYSDINKYGENNFQIIEIEKCSDKEAFDREIYWINYYNTFYNGYNNTYGGSGKHYIDHEQVCNLYSIYKNCHDVSKILNISIDSVYKILTNYNINILPSQTINKDKYSKAINMYDLNGNFLKSFYSISDAAKFLNINFNIINADSHIRDCANNKRKSAYGYKWKFDSDLIRNNEKIKIFKYVF